MRQIQIISLFNEVFEPMLSSSMLYKASQNNLVSFSYIDLREYGSGKRRNVDDTPYGGGDGMLLKVEPLVMAIEEAKKVDNEAKVILPTPRGKTYVQSDAKQLTDCGKGLILICPHYEGYDERLLNWVDYTFSIGNYVLTGGELPAMVIIDSVVRLIPGVLGGENSAEIESFYLDDTSLEYPQYTRPEDFRGHKVPEVLLSGNHQQISLWRDANRLNSQVRGIISKSKEDKK